MRSKLTGMVLMLVLGAAFILLYGCEKDGVWLGEDVLALVDGTRITVEDFKAACKGEVPETPEDRRALLDSLVNNRLASRAAGGEGILSDPKALSELEKFHVERLPYYLLKKLAEQTEVAEEELLEHRKGLDLAASLDVMMIVTEELGDAEAALAELKGGADFMEVANKRSRLKSAERTVSLSDGLYPAGVRAVLNGMKPGELSPVMKMDMGYMVCRLTSRTEAEDLWALRKEGVSARIRQRRVDEEMAAILDRLRSAADLKVDKRVLPGGEVRYTGAVLNGVHIELDAAMFEQEDDPHGSPHIGLNEETVKNALNKIVNNLLLSQEARRLGVQNDPDFQRELEINKDKILARIYVDKVAGRDEAAPEEVRAYYEKNKDKFASQELARVSRILLKDEDTAEKVVGELKAGGDFAALAKKYSEDDASAGKGGDVGWVQVSKLKAPLRDALYDLEAGEVSGVVRSGYGFEVLMATERKPSAVPELADVEETVRKRVVLNKRADKVEALYGRLYKDADVKLNLKLLRSL